MMEGALRAGGDAIALVMLVVVSVPRAFDGLKL
jgi:hypothetical protein